ncbi:hypothetical protein O181_035409 [Austropuccinia psidii MF-1]|uniref:Uncharacterized protein n=1 Tax=Austropuccinia psidii MF-1 TaxID=1389203 RepID=A0A9Q3D2L0_9BASI|nr:hypothetical protein [Austropuccinia psidii MF-1]
MAQKIRNLVPAFITFTNAIRCMAHTIHLAAQDVLFALAPGPPVITNEKEGNINLPMSICHIVYFPNGVNTSYDSIINQISRLASYKKQSPQRHENFIGTLNLIYEKEKTTPENKLFSNVSTRLNSIYDILQKSLALKDAGIQY